MNLTEARANLGHLVTWHPDAGRKIPVRITRIVARTFGYSGPPRVVVQLDGFMSEFDVAPEELSL